MCPTPLQNEKPPYCLMIFGLTGRQSCSGNGLVARMLGLPG